ncbi:MAG: 50S ribosomal protein L30 [Bdellovibrionales bacterium]|nr:50S ribosomal protein L30 [Bdellovibrionales bacterium]
MAESKKITVTLKRSTIGSTIGQKEAVRCLGLKKLGHSVEVADNPAMRGQIKKIQHLLDVKVK